MGRPRKIQNEVSQDSAVEPSTDKILKEITDPFWVIDPRSRIVKRLWTQEDFDRHLARGWMRNG